jgi:O-antigen ligase
VLAHGAAGPQLPKYVLLFIALFAAAFVFRFPMATALLFLAMTDFVLAPDFKTFPVGPITARPHELALAGLLALAVLRPKRRGYGGAPGLALGVFFAMMGFSALLAVSSHATTLSEAFQWGRSFLPLFFFYVIVRLFPEPAERRKLLLGAAILAAVTGVVALLVSLGAGFGSIVGVADAVKAEGEAERVRLPGLSAGYALFWYCAVQVAARVGPRRLLWGALLGGIALDILVSLNRNMWVGIVLGLILMAIIGGSMVRSRISVALAVLAAAAILFVVFGGSGSNEKVVDPILARGATILNPSKTTQENSLQDRAKETEKAWATAQKHLLVGVGVGASFGVEDTHLITSGSFLVGNKSEPQLFLHNQYLYLLLIAGIPGLIAFVLFLGLSIRAAWTRVPRDPAIVACGVGIALIMVSAFVAIYFATDDMTAMLGLLAGVIVADAASRAADGRPSELSPSATS